jgi:cupin fold WbuC family metalloprotein
MATSPRALPPPAGDIVLISEQHCASVLEASRLSERRRTILPFHKGHEDTLHRMFNAVQPGTYVQPHRHLSPPKAEVFLVLRGAIDFLAFDAAGTLTMVAALVAGSEHFGVDVMPGIFHAFIVRAPDTLLYEVKNGPYTAADDKDFASWAPSEGTAGVSAYVAQLEGEIAAFKSARP